MAPRFLILMLLACAYSTSAFAATIEAATLADLGTASVAKIDEDGTITLSGGRVLRLAGIELARGHAAQDLQTTLTGLIGRGPLTLKSDGPTEDRYGRVVAQAFAADGAWIEGELLRHGLARVATTPDHRSTADALYTAERPARTHRLGLWGDTHTALRHAGEIARFIDSWQVVDGTVISVNPRHNAIDLRLGDDEAHDLSIRIPTSIAQAMPTDPATLVGRHLRVRGWIGKGIGPLITLNHAEQIEVVGRPHQRVAEEP